MTTPPFAVRPSAKHLLVLVAAGLITAACSSSSGGSAAGSTAATTAAAPAATAPAASSAPPAAAPAAASTITIKNFAYDVPASVPAGAKITVTNKDGEAHTVSLGGDGKAKVVVQGGSSATLTAPAKAGTYPITCDFHGNMHGQLVVA